MEVLNKAEVYHSYLPSISSEFLFKALIPFLASSNLGCLQLFTSLCKKFISQFTVLLKKASALINSMSVCGRINIDIEY